MPLIYGIFVVAPQAETIALRDFHLFIQSIFGFAPKYWNSTYYESHAGSHPTPITLGLGSLLHSGAQHAIDSTYSSSQPLKKVSLSLTAGLIWHYS